MRVTMTAAALAAMLSASPRAQQPVPPAADAMKLASSSSDVAEMIAKAKRERKPDQANYIQPLVRLAPYQANLEYRVAGLNANAATHEKDAELFYVLDGSGTLVTGGKLKDEKRTNPDNLQGSAIEGGSPRKVAKGDVVLVPENTPHWFTGIDGALVLMSLHLPHAAGGATR